MQHRRNVLHGRRTHTDEQHSFVPTTYPHQLQIHWESDQEFYLEEVPTVTGIIFDFSLIPNNHFVDLTLVRLHLRNPLNSHTWFQSRRTARGGAPGDIRLGLPGHPSEGL